MLESLRSFDVSQTIHGLGSIDFSRINEFAGPIIKDPSSNLTAALLMLAFALLVVLILASAIFAIVATWSSSKRRERDLDEIIALQELLAILNWDESEDEEARELVADEEPQPKPEFVVVPMSPRERLVWILGGVAIVVILTIAVGATTASNQVCVTCHSDTIHTRAVSAGVKDPHNNVACVSCHESSGWLGSVTIEVPERIAHFVNALDAHPKPSQYGDVATSACFRCHRTVASETTVDRTRGVKMSHQAPLAAGAECLYCHTPSTGVVSTLTVGMSPCLRCHDGKQQPATCPTCHVKDFSYATASHVNPGDLQGKALIKTPDCGACHDQVKECDPCHGGTRMPHSDLFKWWGHARQGVESIWNQTDACSRCHYAERRPCTKCHAFFPGHPVPDFKKIHQTQNRGACTPCHDHMAYVPGRDFCSLCHGVRVTQ